MGSMDIMQLCGVLSATTSADAGQRHAAEEALKQVRNMLRYRQATLALWMSRGASRLTDGFRSTSPYLILFDTWALFTCMWFSRMCLHSSLLPVPSLERY